MLAVSYYLSILNEIYSFCFVSRAVIGIGVEDEDKKHTWMEDAESVNLISSLYLS